MNCENTTAEVAITLETAAIPDFFKRIIANHEIAQAPEILDRFAKSCAFVDANHFPYHDKLQLATIYVADAILNATKEDNYRMKAVADCLLRDIKSIHGNEIKMRNSSRIMEMLDSYAGIAGITDKQREHVKRNVIDHGAMDSLIGLRGNIRVSVTFLVADINRNKANDGDAAAKKEIAALEFFSELAQSALFSTLFKM